MDNATEEQRYGPTSGVLTGWAGVVLSALVGVGVMVEDPSATGIGVGALVLAIGVLAWCYLLRPRVLLRPGRMVLRNAFTDWVIPLEAVEDIVVRQTTVVAADDKLYRGIGVGRPLRRIIKDRAGEPGQPSTPGSARSSLSTDEIPDLMVEQVLEQRSHARRDEDLTEPHREYAVPELVALGVLVLAFLVLAVL